MLKIIRAVTHDAAGPRRTRDTLLPSAITQGAPPKMTALGTTWRGDLKAVVDAHVDTVEELLTTLGPNPRTLDLGRVYIGGLAGQLESAGREASAAPEGDKVDTTEVLKEVAGLNAQLVASSPSAVRIFDALRKVRNAVARTAGGRTADANPLANVLVNLLDEARAVNEQANARSRDLERSGFWGGGSTATRQRATGDNSSTRTTAFREAHHAVQNALDPQTLNEVRALNEALNVQARAFWQRA